MPFVKIDLFEGRSEEQKIELAREVTEVVSRVAKAPKEAIHVFINDMPEGTYYPHGEMKKKNESSRSSHICGLLFDIKNKLNSSREKLLF